MRSLLREIWWTVWTFILANYVAFIAAPENFLMFWGALWVGLQGGTS